jgi:hypothetical protein
MYMCTLYLFVIGSFIALTDVQRLQARFFELEWTDDPGETQVSSGVAGSPGSSLPLKISKNLKSRPKSSRILS